MSILIRGMDMPMSCESCQFRRCISNLIMFSWVGCQLDVGIAKKESFKGRHPDCPLIEVKAPHGRLKDVDKILNGEGRYVISFGKDGIDTEEINRAPTIIEAEGKDDV